MGPPAQPDVCQHPAYFPAGEIDIDAARNLPVGSELELLGFCWKFPLLVENQQFLLPMMF